MILRLVLAFIALSILSCAKPKDLEYVDFRNLKVLQFGLKESTVAMDIEFFNPNRYQIQIKKADVDVYINNTFLGKSTLDSLIRIPGKDIGFKNLLRDENAVVVAGVARNIGTVAHWPSAGGGFHFR